MAWIAPVMRSSARKVMRATRLAAGGSVLLSLGLAAATSAGCTHSDTKLSINEVPLAPGVRVGDEAYGCPVSPDACFRWVVLEGARYRTDQVLKTAQRRRLSHMRWRFSGATSRMAVAADSPDRRLFISFETGRDQLAEERQGRSSWGNAKLSRHLERLVAQHSPALAVTLEPGPHTH
jgi:hypothetical protein